MVKSMNRTLRDLLTTVGVSNTARISGISVRAIYKWIERGRLPRTEYTGETNYAERIETATNGLVTANELLKPAKTPTEAA